MKKVLLFLLILVFMVICMFSVSAGGMIVDTEEEIELAYIKHLYRPELTPSSVGIVRYYGTYNGYRCVVMSVWNDLITHDTGKLEINGITFNFEYSAYVGDFFLYKDGKLTHILQGYQDKLIDDFDLYCIAQKHGDFTIADSAYKEPVIVERDGVIYEFDIQNGTLILSGEGAIPDYLMPAFADDMYISPLCDLSFIKHVIIKEGITRIGKYYFLCCENLETVQLPDSMEEIALDAFYSCPKLKKIIFPEGIKRIEYFDNCLNEIWFYGNLPEIINDGPFRGFNGIIYVPYGNETWTNEAIEKIDSIVGTEISWGFWNAPEIKNAVNEFIDLKSDAWYINAVQYVYEKGIMSGVGNNSFDPAGVVTREQMVQVLYEIANGKEGNPYADTGFTDVKKGRWYTPAVKWAKLHNITAGIGNGVFGLGKPLTREQLAVFIMNYAEKSGCEIYTYSDIKKYHDANCISSWAVKGMSFCLGQGIFNGKGDSMLDPRGYATRAELAQVIMKFGYWLDEHNAYRLVINCKDHGYVENVKVNGILPSSQVILPLSYILNDLGVQVEWESNNKGSFTYGEELFIIDMSDGTKLLDEEGNSLLFPAPGGNMYVGAEEYELMLDSVTLKSVLYIIGIEVQTGIDINNKVLNVYNV